VLKSEARFSHAIDPNRDLANGFRKLRGLIAVRLEMCTSNFCQEHDSRLVVDLTANSTTASRVQARPQKMIVVVNFLRGLANGFIFPRRSAQIRAFHRCHSVGTSTVRPAMLIRRAFSSLFPSPFTISEISVFPQEKEYNVLGTAHQSLWRGMTEPFMGSKLRRTTIGTHSIRRHLSSWYLLKKERNMSLA
jgi:hypothetical protein